ncbi:MAG: hypothetical protein V3U51_03375 [Thermoplasmata archaeon]
MDPLTLLLAASVFTLIGVIAGIATGLIPGLHVNNMPKRIKQKVVIPW